MCRTMPGGQVPEDRCTWGDDQFGPPWGWRAHQMVAGMAEIGQRCDKPMHEKEEGHPTQDTLAEPGLGGITYYRWDVCFWWTGHHLRQLDVVWSVWQCAGVIWHVWQLGGALEGPTFCFLDVELAQKGPTSPSEGPDVSLLAHILMFLAFNVINSEILLSQPCRLF